MTFRSALNLDDARRKVREVSTKMIDICESKTMAPAAQTRALAPLEPELAHWLKEIDDREHINAQLMKYCGTTDTGSVNSYQQGGRSASSLIGNAPPITLDDGQAHAMFDALRGRKSFRVDVGEKGTPLDAGQPAYRVSPPLGLPREPHRILDHIPMAATTAPSVEYLRIASVTGVAALTAAGTPKPELVMNSATATLVVPKIACFMRVVDEVLADYAGFLGFLHQELTRAVVDAESDIVLNNTTSGLLHTTGILTRTRDAAYLDAIEQAFADLRSGPAFVDPDLIVLHPADLSAIRRIKDNVGNYVLARDPSVSEVTSLWGVPTLTTTQIASGTVLIGNFAAACQGWTRQGLAVDGASTGDDWRANISAIRAEERVGVAVVRPAALLKLDLALGG